MEYLHYKENYIVWGESELWVKIFNTGTSRWKKSTLVKSDSEFGPNIKD